MQKKSAKYSNLFIGHSVKRSFVRSFMMSYLSGKKSRLILHSIVPNILYKGRWLFMLLSKSRNFFWSKRYLIFLKVLDFYQKIFLGSSYQNFIIRTHKSRAKYMFLSSLFFQKAEILYRKPASKLCNKTLLGGRNSVELFERRERFTIYYLELR